MYATYERRWWTLSVLCLSLVMIILGNTVLNVALPTLQRNLGASGAELQWMVDAYALVFAGLLLTGGAFGDRFGRKGMLQVGLVVFGLSSLAATQATQPLHVVLARAAMGVGAAMVMPATLSILTSVFPPQERAKAIGVWAGLAASAGAIGPIAGGWLVDHFSWSAVFYLNVPTTITALVAGIYLVPTSRDPEKAPLDPIGALLSILGLTALLYAIIEAPDHGWLAGFTLAGFGVAALLLTVFGAWELRVEHPMLDLRAFRVPRLSAAAAAITLNFLAIFGLFFVLTQYLQFVRGYDPLQAGLHTLPAPITMMLFSFLSAPGVERFGPRRVVVTGMAMSSLGLFLMSRLGTDTPYLTLAVGLTLVGVGIGLVGPPSTTAIMASLPPGKSGVGSAVNDTSREVGGALGVAILGSLLASGYHSSVNSSLTALPASVRGAAGHSVGGALAVAENLPKPVADAFSAAARHAFVDGMHLVFLLAGLTLLAAGAVVARWYPNVASHAVDAVGPVDGDPEAPSVATVVVEA